MMDDAAPTRRISLNAHVASWVTLGAGCVVHDFALVGRVPSQSVALARKPAAAREIYIGDGTEIGAHAVVYAGANIGANCLIGDGSLIREGVTIRGRCVIGAHAIVGYDAEIGAHVKIMDGAQIAGGCRIGPGSFIGPGVRMSNDGRPNIADYTAAEPNPPIIGQNCMIGAGAILLPGVRIGDGARVWAGSIVSRDVPPGGIVHPTPARIWEPEPA